MKVSMCLMIAALVCGSAFCGVKGPRKAVFGPGQQDVHIKEICEFAGKKNPKTLVFETAEGDAESEVTARVKSFKLAGADVEPIRMHKEKIDPVVVRRKIMEADIVWFGCGVAEWLLNKIDFYYLEDTIKAAYRNGTVLCGNSAGSLIQAYGGYNDFSDGRYDFMRGLGIIRAYFVPHFQAEQFRKGFEERLAIETDPETPDVAWAVENGAGVFFVNEKPEVRRIVGKGESPAAKAFRFTRKNGKWIKSEVPPANTTTQAEKSSVSSSGRPCAATHFVAEHPWKAFYFTNSMEAVAAKVSSYSDTLTLPSGEVLKGKDFSFDAENRSNLDDLFGIKHVWHWEPNETDFHHAILVNELYAPADGVAMIGTSAEWFFTFYANGKKCYTTWPDGDGSDDIEFTNHVFPVPLKKGRNVVAIHTHRGLGRWFVAFGECPKIPATWSHKQLLEFLRPEKSQIDCGPWLSYPKADSVTISFILPKTRRAGVEYRKVGTETWTKTWQQSAIQKKTDELFHYELKGLEADAKYEYRVMTIVGTEVKRSPIHHFRTFSAKPQPVRLTVTTDSHIIMPEDADDRFAPITKLPGAMDADVFIDLGDEVSYGRDIRKEMIDGYMKGVLRHFGHDRYVVTLHGNHEWRGEDASAFFTYFPKSYYSARLGEAYLLVLDSGERDPIDSWQAKDDPDAAYHIYDKAYMAEQRKWLENEVKSEACRTAKYRIVMIHCPPTYTLKYETPHMKTLLDGLLVSWDKDKKPEILTHLWLTGHKHESWFRQRMGINELQICGPNHDGGGLGAAIIEVGPDTLKVKDWHVLWNEIAYDIEIAPDGKVAKLSGARVKPPAPPAPKKAKK